MKSTGRHPEKKLTTTAVHAKQVPGRYADGNGLYLIVDLNGAKRWLLHVVVQGKRRDIGLGGLSMVTLAQAREKAIEFRRLLVVGATRLHNDVRLDVLCPHLKRRRDRYTEIGCRV